MWGKTEKRESFKEMSPKNEEAPCQLRKLAGVLFISSKKQSLLAIFLYQIIRIRITQFFCFIEIASKLHPFSSTVSDKVRADDRPRHISDLLSIYYSIFDSLFIPSHTQDLPLLALPYKSGLSDSVDRLGNIIQCTLILACFQGSLFSIIMRTYHSPVR